MLFYDSTVNIELTTQNPDFAHPEAHRRLAGDSSL